MVNLPGGRAALGAIVGGWFTVEDTDRMVASQGMAPGGTVAVKVTREGPHFPLPETQPEAKDFDPTESPKGQHCCLFLIPGSLGIGKVWIQSRLWGRGKFVQASGAPSVSFSG